MGLTDKHLEDRVRIATTEISLMSTDESRKALMTGFVKENY
jgi:hypothetical protein